MNNATLINNPIANIEHLKGLTDVLIVVKTGLGMKGVEKYTTGMAQPQLSGDRNTGKRFSTIGRAVRTLERLTVNYQSIWVEGYREEGTEGKLSLVTYIFNHYTQRWEFSSAFPTGIKAK